MDEEYNKLNYIGLLNHIKQYHPTRLARPGELDDEDQMSIEEKNAKEVRFGICEYLGSL